MRAAFANTGLVIASLVISLLVIEIAVRFYITPPKPYGLVPESSPADIRFSVFDKRGFFAWRPGYRGWFDNGVDFVGKRVTTNANGGRTVPCAAHVGAPENRIFLIGDSQTFGWGLADDETWANRFQCDLNGRLPGRFRVHNLAYPGAQVDQLYMRAIGQVEPAAKPGDIAIISFTWNDLITFYKPLSFVDAALKDAGLRQIPDKGGSTAKVRSLGNIAPANAPAAEAAELKLSLSNPVNYLRTQSWRYPIYNEYGLFIPSFESAWAFLNSLQYLSAAFQVAWSNARLLYYRFRPSDELTKKIPPGTFRSNFLVLRSLQDRLKQKGVRVFVQLLPSRLFYDDYYYNAYSANGVAFPARDYLAHVAMPYCKSLQLHCLNRFGELISSKKNAHSFPYDGHINPIGAARIGRALSDDLQHLLR